MPISQPLCFVDIETTGTNALSGRIIEIGILKVQDGELIETYETLINPEMRVDPFIEQMTGINYESLTGAPLFGDIKDKLIEILDESIFVAHNVRFDYGFVRNEFRRQGVNFKSKHFCTVKLARALYPGLAHYNLDAIMSEFKIENKNRHRAFGDAQVLWEFYKISEKINEKEKFQEAIKLVLKKPTLPPGISREEIEELPESPGVYIFLDANSAPIYIGKSINIKERVLSHFANDYGGATDMKIYQTVKNIKYQETAGELGALLLEAKLIKEMKPAFNRMLRISNQRPVILKSRDRKGFKCVNTRNLDEIEVNDIENLLGVFKSKKQMKDYLYEMCKEYKLCPKVMGREKGKGMCFSSQIGQCLGACGGKESALKYNLRFDEAFLNTKVKRWQFDGPILVKEKNDLISDGETNEEIHVIDKWCYLGSLNNENDRLEDISREYKFDWDTYKILRRYLLRPDNLRRIMHPQEFSSK